MRRLGRAGEVFVRGTQTLAAAILALSLALIFYQVFTRFVLGEAATWTEVLTRGLVIWMVFLVAGAGFRAGAMISLDAAAKLLTPRGARALRLLVTAATLLALGLLAWHGTLMAWRVRHQTIAMLDVPIAWFYAAIPVGALFAIPGVLLAFAAPRARTDAAGKDTA